MYALGKVYIYCIKLYAQGVCIMVQFISRRKADFGKAALFVALYACINICLVSLLKEGLYLHGLHWSTYFGHKISKIRCQKIK